MQSLCWTSRLILHPQIAQAQRDAPSDTYSKENPLHDSYQMTNLYVTFLNSMVSAGMSGPFMQYTHVGNCWGLKMATGDSNAKAPKYQGVLNWLAAHP